MSPTSPMSEVRSSGVVGSNGRSDHTNAPLRKEHPSACSPPYSQTAPTLGSDCSSRPLPTSDTPDAAFHSLPEDKPPAKNRVRVVPVPYDAMHPVLHMDIISCEDSDLFVLQNPDGSEVEMDMGDILRRHSSEIVSISVDTTGVPNPSDPSPFMKATILPLLPGAAVSKEQTLPSDIDPAFPTLSSLQELSITVSRAPSIAQLLRLFKYTPMLRTLAVTNSAEHQAVLPESVSHITHPAMPLESIKIVGLLPETVEQLLDELSPSIDIELRTTVEVHFVEVYLPPWKLDSAPRKLFTPIRHAHLSCTVVQDNHPSPPSLSSPAQPNQSQDTSSSLNKRYAFAFTFSDAAKRVQFHWRWTEEQDPIPYLGHISLATPALARVHTVSLALSGVRPCAPELRHLLQSFCSLTHVHLRVGAGAGSAENGAQVPVVAQNYEFSAPRVVCWLANVRTLFALGIARDGLGCAPSNEPQAVSWHERCWCYFLWTLVVRKAGPAANLSRLSYASVLQALYKAFLLLSLLSLLCCVQSYI